MLDSPDRPTSFITGPNLPNRIFAKEKESIPYIFQNQIKIKSISNNKALYYDLVENLF